MLLKTTQLIVLDHAERGHSMHLLRHGFAKAPWWLRTAVPYALWRCDPKDKAIYLTFDDGPTPGVTEEVLRMLAEYQAKATFFCIGKQAEDFPELLKAVHDQGHLIGNHTYSHRNGWATPSREYIEEIERTNRILTELTGIKPRYFRPPFGRITPFHWWRLRREFQICMWDVTGGDFIEELNADDVEQTVLENSTPGSLVLLHDSHLAAPRSLEALPGILDGLQRRGFRFCSLPAI